MGVLGTAKNRTYEPVADFFIALSNVTGNLISNLKLQKLVYYADAWHLANHGVSIIQEDFQAWVHGPVIPALYGEYKHFSWQPIERSDLDEKAYASIRNNLEQKTVMLLDAVADSYFGLSAYELEKMTHSELPWRAARNGLADDEPSDNVISKEIMKDYYSSFIKKDGPQGS